MDRKRRSAQSLLDDLGREWTDGLVYYLEKLPRVAVPVMAVGIEFKKCSEIG